jgi:hypothetical protein
MPGEAEMTLDRAIRDDFRVNYYRCGLFGGE